jgi:hypothetical protein
MNKNKTVKLPESDEHYGSFKIVEVKGNHKMFMGLSEDVSLLPNDMEGTITGSAALCVDTGELYFYEESTKTWYQL